MNEKLQAILQKVKEQVEVEVSEFRDQVTLQIAPEDIVATLQFLRDACSFEMLNDETAVDYWPQETPRFHVVYQIYSMKENLSLTLRVPLNGDDPRLTTIESVYPSANWYEREVWDMFGIHFDGHSDPRRILMPANYKGFPQRKDSPLGYEEVAFSFDTDEINRSKPHARE